MASNANVGYAFPLRELGSDIARNQYNYESILNGLVEWDKTQKDTVVIRLTKDTDPWYEDYIIPSKNAVMNTNGGFQCAVSGQISPNCFSMGCIVDVAVSGGHRELTHTTFDALTDVNTGTTPDEITVANITGFEAGDFIKFEPADITDNSNIIPSGLSMTVLYTIHSISGNTITVGDANGAVVNSVGVGHGAVVITKKMMSTISSTDDPCDSVTFRETVAKSGGVTWEIWYQQLIREWVAGDSYTYGNVVLYSGILYRLVFDKTKSIITPNLDAVNFVPAVTTWVQNAIYSIGQLVSYQNALYSVISLSSVTDSIDGKSTVAPELDTKMFKLYADKWVVGTNYAVGSFVAYNNIPYIATNAIQSSNSTPLVDVDNWSMSLVNPVPTASAFSSTQIFRWSPAFDVSAFYVRNATERYSASSTDLTLTVSVRAKQPDSIYQRTTAFYKTSNYSMWPLDTNIVWKTGMQYQTDVTRTPRMRQAYSSSMIFDHTRADISKTINYINYDGPDLDQGMCIYLPSEVDVGNGSIAYPEDGFTFEFFFRIWPNPVYTGARTRDHIVNKAQIYVYDAMNYEQVQNDTCTKVIAKFSMARMTNFYMFGENVSLPDKPVCYRATFVYSDALSQWITMDYYQLPDHVFMGPVGFIDPQNPANLDLSGVVGGNNPNPQFIGYETAAFPMFQDPFSKVDLTPYRESSNTDAENYSLRII